MRPECTGCWGLGTERCWTDCPLEEPIDDAEDYFDECKACIHRNKYNDMPCKSCGHGQDNYCAGAPVEK